MCQNVTNLGCLHRTRWGLPVALALLLVVGGNARADEAYYYLLVFGAQEVPARAETSHTFATFVRATGQGPCAESYCLEAQTISWLPRTLDLRLLALLPECGQNLELHATIQWALSLGDRVSMWGPYQIQKELYDRACAQVALLQSGEVEYKVIDTGYYSDVACNCIHAVSSIATGQRLRILSPSFGETASYHVARRLEPWIIDPSQTHDWVATRLGLDCYPILRRELRHPQSGVILGAMNRLIGRDPTWYTTRWASSAYGR